MGRRSLWKASTWWNPHKRGFVGRVKRDWESHDCPHKHREQSVALRCAVREAERRNG